MPSLIGEGEADKSVVLQKVSKKRRSSLVIFGRAPAVGRVKTRLAATIGALAAADFYAAMLLDSLSLAVEWQRRFEAVRNEAFSTSKGVATSVQSASVALAFTPRTAFDEATSGGVPSLSKLWMGERFAQAEGDLGDKMWHALNRQRECGAERVVIIGSDAPDLPLAILDRAFALLEENDVVFGPASDGGFTLVGASRALPQSFFGGVDWTAQHTLQPCLENAARLKLRTAQTALWHDVDTIDDLRSLHQRLLHQRLLAASGEGNFEIAPATRQWLQANFHSNAFKVL